MEDAWKEYKLGEIAEFKTGKLNSNAAVSNGKYPFFTCAPETYYIDDYAFDQKAILLAGNNAEGNFNIKYYEGKFNAYQRTYVINPINNDVDIHYLYYALQLCLQSFKALSQGTSTKFLTAKILNAFSLQIPSTDKQKRIVCIIKALDDKIENNKRINDNLQQQACALYKSWFVDFDPFNDGQFEDSELGLIPHGWSVKQLGEITSQINEKVKERTDVKVLSPITTGQLVLSEEYFTKQVFSESISKYIVVKPSDFAYNPARVNIGSLGMNEYEFDGCVSPVYVVFRCEDGYQYFFDLFRRTETFKEEVRTRAIGGVRQSLAYKDFSLIKVVYPPIDVIHSFNQVYSRIRAKTKHNDEETARLASLRDTLLPKLMSGELKTNELTM